MHIAPLPPLELLEQLRLFTEKCGLSSKSVQIYSTVKDLIFTSLNEADLFFQTNTVVGIAKANLNFQLPEIPNQHVILNISDDGGLSFLITIEKAQQIGRKRDAFFAALQQAFDIVPKSQIIQSTMPDIVQQQLASAQNAYDSLHSQTTKLGEYLTTAAVRNSEFIEKLTADHVQRQQESEAAFQNQVARQDAAFQEKQNELLEHEKKLNLREHRGVRRETLEQLNKAIDGQKDFIVSEQTTKKGRLIHIMCWSSMIVGLLIALSSSVHVAWTSGGLSMLQTGAGDTSTPSFETYARFGTGMLLFSSTLIFYLRWLNFLYSKHAETEFHNLKFSKDVLRASWLAELVLEAHNPTDESQQNFDIPEFLLERFSEGLFTDPGRADVRHPIDDLQKYAKHLKKLTVGPVQMESKTSDA